MSFNQSYIMEFSLSYFSLIVLLTLSCTSLSLTEIFTSSQYKLFAGLQILLSFTTMIL